MQGVNAKYLSTLMVIMLSLLAFGTINVSAVNFTYSISDGNLFSKDGKTLLKYAESLGRYKASIDKF